MRRPNHLSVICLLGYLCLWGTVAQAQESSVLSESGSWFKIPVTEDGVYAITHDYLNGLGVDPSSLNLENIQLFGYGGGMLPQSISEPRYNDLPEIAMGAIGLNDDSFDQGDRLVFYAQGPHRKAFDVALGYCVHEINVYTDTAYVFLRINGSEGKRIGFRPVENPSNPQNLTWFPQGLWVEKEETNRDHSGRNWYENAMESGSRRDYTFATPDFASGGDVTTVRAGVMIQSYATAPIEVLLNEQLLGEITTTNTAPGQYGLKGVEGEGAFSVPVGTQTLSQETRVGLRFQAAGTSVSNGHPDYITLTYPRRLQVRPDLRPTFFFHTLHRTGQPLRVQLANAQDVQVWDITQPTEPQRVQTTGTNGQISFAYSNATGGQFVALRPGAVPAPLPGESIGYTGFAEVSMAELVIVTHPDFLPAARRLARFRERWDGLNTAVVTTEDVFYRFGSGMPDVSAIRNMARWIHEQNSQFDYLLLFGKGTYDYKHLDSESPDYNLVPVYQSRNSLNPLRTFSSDDYLGFLDDNEGLWLENNGGNHSLEIGVGRLPVISLAEAQTVVDKLIHYAESSATLGDWRQRLVFLADDGDNNLHLRDAERITRYLDTAQMEYYIQKLYLDAFPQIPLGSLQDAPAARKALNEMMYRGSLMVNYTGHGNERSWAEEGFFREDLIDQWSNLDHMPLFITATCEFGRHDDSERRSAAESVLLYADGGAIGLLTTSRPVFSNSNFLVNRVFFEQAYLPLPNGEAPRLGDVMRRTKNRSQNGVDNRNFILLGDPSMRLAYPQYEARVTSINGMATDTVPDTLLSLRRVFLTGEVVNGAGSVVSDFNGKVTVALYDDAVTRSTLGNPPENVPYPYWIRDNLLFRGQAKVTQGQFSLDFILPQSIDYRSGEGRLLLYAHDSSQVQDALGSTDQLVILGGHPAGIDLSPPELSLYLNDTTFTSGGITHPDPVLVVRTHDPSGINLSRTQLGQGLRARIDDGDPADLSDYFSATTDDFTRGEARFPFFDLTPGRHRVWVQAYDVYNNGIEQSLPFIVSERGEIALREVFNYPNPFSTFTTFRIEHDRAGEDLEVRVDVYSAQGAQIRTLEWEVPESTSIVDGLDWDGTDEQGRPLQSGMYLYRVFLKSMEDEVYTETIQRFVVIK